LDVRQDIAEHEHEVWQKSSNIFTSFAPKLRRHKEATIFVPSSSAATAIEIKNFVLMKRGSLGRCKHLRKLAETTARRLKRDGAANRG
jgi:hypothetical protein